MADDDRTPSAEIESMEDMEGEDDEEDREEESGTGGGNGYFSRTFRRTIRGDDLERRIEMIEEEEEALESRMVVRGRTAEQVNRSVVFLSVNLEFVVGIYAYLRIRSRNLSWRARVIRMLPVFLIPAVASFFYTFFSRFTSMLNLRDSRLLERLRKEREAKVRELKGRANYYMTIRHNQNCHGESSSMASSMGQNLPETSHTRDITVNPSLSWGERKQIQLERNTCHDDAQNSTVTGENRKKKLRNLLICSTCRMHIGFASRDELPSISYKCPHCNALNGPHKEQINQDSASTSAEGAPQSQPYNPFSIPEMPRGIFIEEITPNHVTTDPEMDTSVIIIRESPTIGGSEESPFDSTPNTSKLPIGISIEEMASNGEPINAEIQPEVDPLSVPEIMETGVLSVEEIINPNNQQTEDHETITPIVSVQDSPLADSQVELLSDRNLSDTAADPVIEFPRGLSIEEVSPNHQLTVTHEMDPPVMIVDVTPIEVPELQNDTVNTDGSVRSLDDSESSGTFHEVPEQSQEETNDNADVYDNIDGDDYESDSNTWGPFVSGPGATSTVTVSETHPEIDEKSPSKSYSESEANSDYGSFTDVNEDDKTLDMETRAGVSENSDGVTEQKNSRYQEGDSELFASTYDDTNGDFGSSTVSEYEGSGTVNEENQLTIDEMPIIDTGDAVEEPEENQQEGSRSSVSASVSESENSDSAEESRGHDHDDPNGVGSVAYDRDKGSTLSMKKDRIIKKKNRRGDVKVEEISDKEGSLKKQETQPKPITMASEALLSLNSGLDPQSKPFTGIVSDPSPNWSANTEFEPARAVGLRHRR